MKKLALTTLLLSGMAQEAEAANPRQATAQVQGAEVLVDGDELRASQLAIESRYNEIMTSEMEDAARRDELASFIGALSKHAYCVAASEWALTYGAKFLYSGTVATSYHAPGVGEGDLFENVVLPIMTQGCLSPQERAKFFTAYQRMVVRGFLEALNEIQVSKDKLSDRVLLKDPVALEMSERLEESWNHLHGKLQRSRNTTYGDLFHDESLANLTFEQTKNAAQQRVQALMDRSLDPETKITELGKLQDLFLAAYDNPKMTPELAAELDQAILMAFDYQSKLEFELRKARSPQDQYEYTFEGGEIVGEGEMSGVLRISRAAFDPEPLVVHQEFPQSEPDARPTPPESSLWFKFGEAYFYGLVAQGYSTITRDYEDESKRKARGELWSERYLNAWKAMLETAGRNFAKANYVNVGPFFPGIISGDTLYVLSTQAVRTAGVEPYFTELKNWLILAYPELAVPRMNVWCEVNLTGDTQDYTYMPKPYFEPDSPTSKPFSVSCSTDSSSSRDDHARLCGAVEDDMAGLFSGVVHSSNIQAHAQRRYFDPRLRTNETLCLRVPNEPVVSLPSQVIEWVAAKHIIATRGSAVD